MAENLNDALDQLEDAGTDPVDAFLAAALRAPLPAPWTMTDERAGCPREGYIRLHHPAHSALLLCNYWPGLRLTDGGIRVTVVCSHDRRLLTREETLDALTPILTTSVRLIDDDPKGPYYCLTLEPATYPDHSQYLSDPV
jgi:hypothetical protein